MLSILLLENIIGQRTEMFVVAPTTWEVIESCTPNHDFQKCRRPFAVTANKQKNRTKLNVIIINNNECVMRNMKWSHIHMFLLCRRHVQWKWHCRRSLAVRSHNGFRSHFPLAVEKQYDDLVHINAMVAQGVVVLPNRGAFEECLAASHWDGFGLGFRVRPQ